MATLILTGYLPFVMLDSNTHLPVAGKTVTVERLIDSGAWATTGLSNIQDKGNGLYTVDGTAAVSNGTFVSFRATATGCDPSLFTIVTIP